MNRPIFTKALSKQFYPLLRAEGFRGSGTTLRRIINPIVHVVNVQASSGGDCCFINLGAHLMFLPTPGGGNPDAGSLKEYECVFRDRFDPPAGIGFGFLYGESESEMNETIAFICDHWAIGGHSFFAKYSSYPNDFQELVDDVEAKSAHSGELLTLARIAAHLGDKARAGSLAQEALERCPPRASTLRAHLKQVVRKVQ